jgi:hypothetical protein
MIALNIQLPVGERQFNGDSRWCEALIELRREMQSCDSPEIGFKRLRPNLTN